MLPYMFKINDRVKLNKSLGGPVLGRVVSRRGDALVYTVTFTTGKTADFPEEALSHWDTSKDADYMAVIRDESEAHGDYRAVERFRELKDAAKVLPINTGDSVAFLYEKSGKLTLAYGKKFDSKNSGTNGYRIGIVTRDGERFYVHYEHVTRIES